MNARVVLEDVAVEFPIYQGGSRSLKKQLLWRGTGGSVGADAHHRVVVKALDDISLKLEHGDRVGLVGHNGAGKSTLLRVLAGVYEPMRGRLTMHGRVCPIFDINLGLDHDATGLDNIFLRGALLGISAREMRPLVDDIAAFTDLGPYLHMPLRSYSSGMMLRLAFAISTSVHPEILLIDESILAGDQRFLDKASQRLSDFVGRASILVVASHSALFLKQWCTTGMLMRAGRIVRQGPIDDVLAEYAAANLAARGRAIELEVPSVAAVPL